MLYRYSALTFNGHRIHYDVDYARSVEGYEDLVFHGPLTATLLANLAHKFTGKALTSFTFKGLAPITANHQFHIEGKLTDLGMDLWAKRHDGALAMKATAVF
jgi:3-methylfumaryl-CoA hydratase